MKYTIFLAPAACAVALTLFAPTASADVLSPELENCEDKAAGAACNANPVDDGKSLPGTCQESTCQDNHLYPADSGPHPSSYSCLLCKAEDGTATNGLPVKSGSSTTTSSNSGGGCAMGGARAAAPWLLALLPLALCSLRRKKK